jgi:hypothetical protein
LEREEHDRKWAEAEKRRAEQEERQRQEQLKIKDLLEKTNKWHESQKIKAFLDALNLAQVKTGLPDGGDKQLLDWIAWARQYAKSLDPIKDSEESNNSNPKTT